MPKKIRFPLKLADDTQARTLEELREHFDLESVLGYYKTGKLLTWLEDRYLEGEAEAIRALDETAPDFQRKLCEVFQVEYIGDDADMEAIQLRQERLAKLRTITDEPEFIDHIDQIAFDQEELADLLDEDETTIYLCGGKFTVPASRKGMTYIGINNPAVHISGKLPEMVEELEIIFRECAVNNLPRPKPVSVSAEAIIKDVWLECTGRDYELQVDFEEPVELGDRKYEHIPVPCDLVANLELCEGATLRIHRDGDVISSITVIDEGDGELIEFPSCPHCGRTLDIKNKKLYCSSVVCDSNIVNLMVSFLNAIGCDGYGESFITELREALGKSNIRTIASLFRYSAKDLKEAGMDSKLAKKFPEVLREGVRKAPDYILLGAIGIPDVDPVRAKEILKKYGGWDKFRMKLSNDVRECENPVPKGPGRQKLPPVLTCEGHRNHLSENIHAIKDTVDTLSKLMENITTDFTEKVKVGYTGLTLDDDICDICKRHGFEIVDDDKFDVLITINLSYKSKKMEKAIKTDKPIYTTADFIYDYANS